jgi:transposase
VWASRYRNLGRTRTQAACRLHAVLCELVPGGFSRRISAAQAGRVLAEIVAPPGAAGAARLELARELLADLARIDEQRRAIKRRLTRLVAATKSAVSGIYGVGPVVAGTVLGYVGDIGRFPTRDHFAAYNGTAPIEVSSGPRKVYRLSRRGNRQLNHVIHMAAVTQISHAGTEGRGYYDRKIAEGKTGKEALRALKRRISDALYHAMIHARRRDGRGDGGDPGGQTGNDSASSATGSHPEQPALRTSHSRATPQPRRALN